MFPEVGNPLYVVDSYDEARFIIQKVKHRAEHEAQKALQQSGEGMVVHDMKKAVGKLTKAEKVGVRKGDKTILYEKLGLLEEKDLKQYQTKFGISSDQMHTEEDLIENLKDKTIIGVKRQRSGYHQRREA